MEQTLRGASMGPVQRAIIATLLAASLLAATSAFAQPVAMVTDLQGRAAIVQDTGRRELTILTEIAEGARVDVDGGARLILVYLKAGDEYAISGPAQIRLAALAPDGISGAKPIKRGNPLDKGGKEIRIRPVGVTQGAVVMRSGRPAARIKLLTLSGTKTLDARPEFRWESAERVASYRLTLVDEVGRTLLEQDVAGNSFTVPENIGLREGAIYSWEISARLADGRRYVSTGDFGLAPAQLRQEVEALRPGSDAPVSQRIAFAAWLESVDLRDEARKYWKAAAVERPEDSRLRQLASE